MTTTIGYIEDVAGADGVGTIANRTFYGFRIDGASGKLYVDCLTGDSPVSLPPTDITTEVGIKNDDYLQWFWSKGLVTLYWGDNATTWKNHLLMKVL